MFKKAIVALCVIAVIVIGAIAACQAFQPEPVESFVQIQPVAIWADTCTVRVDQNPARLLATNAIVKVADLIQYKNPGRIINYTYLKAKSGLSEYIVGVQLEFTKVNPVCTDIETNVLPTHWYIDRGNYTLSQKDQ